MDLSVNRPRPRFACMACRRLKKKCDRREPQCAQCSRARRKCAYSEASLNEIPIRTSASISTGSVSGAASDQWSDYTNQFPAVFFLDSDLFRRSISQLPTHALTISAELEAFVSSKSQMHDHATAFFTKIHPWIPFVSKRAFYEGVLSSIMPTAIEHVLLLAAVKLVTASPATLDARSALYRHIKATLAELEIVGQLAFRALQALTLVALFELGHAIYPAAYLTIGQCTRYGIALGLDQRIEATAQRSSNSKDSEEERRTWWAIVILDRYVTSLPIFIWNASLTVYCAALLFLAKFSTVPWS
jgi:hypothetical protein